MTSLRVDLQLYYSVIAKRQTASMSYEPTPLAESLEVYNNRYIFVFGFFFFNFTAHRQ